MRCCSPAASKPTPDDIPAAFRRYETVRRERTSQIQGTSQKNTWMREATDPAWVYGYDAWTAPLDPAPSPVAA